jgi:Flp pilus assembly protein CpaB
MQPYFIAKDKDNVPLNNGADYSNALKMWAKNSIPKGIPLTMEMLTQEDPVKKAKAAKEKQKKLDAEKKNNSEHGIRKGMRAVTFSLDQRSLASSGMLAPGDWVDVLIMEDAGGRARAHKYKGLKIIAIDGVTRREKDKAEESLLSSATIGSMSNIVNMGNAKQITLEVKEQMVEIMIKQASHSGIIVSIRNQEEEVDEKEQNKDLDDSFDESEGKGILNEILAMNHCNSVYWLISAKKQAENDRKNERILVDDLNAANGAYRNCANGMILDDNKITQITDEAERTYEKKLEETKEEMKKEFDEKLKAEIAKAEIEKAKKEKEKKKKKRSLTSDVAGDPATSDASSGSGYEIMSGKIVGEEAVKEETEEKGITIHKKLSSERVELDEDGSILDPRKAGPNGNGGR